MISVAGLKEEEIIHMNGIKVAIRPMNRKKYTMNFSY